MGGHERKAMVVEGVGWIKCTQWHSYHAVTSALVENFTSQGLVHLYQAELKARKKKGDESMADLRRDVARLVRIAYPSVDGFTREVIGINAFLDALPGPALDI